MSFTIASVSQTDQYHVRMTFSAPALNDSALTNPSSYPIAPLVGPYAEPVFVKRVTPQAGGTINYVDLTLDRRLSDAARYTFAAQSIKAADQTPISGSGVTLTVVGGEHRKAAELKKLVPSNWDMTAGSVMEAIMHSIGESDHTVAGDTADSGVKSAKNAMLLDAADGEDLSVIGMNVGVRRPNGTQDDGLYRKLIPLLSYQPKQVIKSICDVLTAFYGPASDGGWVIYEINQNELVVEINTTFGSDSPTYLYPDATVATAVDVPPGYLLADASHDVSEVGFGVVLSGDATGPLRETLELTHAAGVVIRFTRKGA